MLKAVGLAGGAAYWVRVQVEVKKVVAIAAGCPVVAAQASVDLHDGWLEIAKVAVVVSSPRFHVQSGLAEIEWSGSETYFGVWCWDVMHRLHSTYADRERVGLVRGVWAIRSCRLGLVTSVHHSTMS